MSEQLPAPDFDSHNYSRPNDRWICGHAREGRPCPVGPDNRGRCRAGPECVPVLERKPAEAKGRWRCTRPGRPCETGPLPDGSCCCQIPKCTPKATLRTIRGRVTLQFVAGTCAILLILLGGSWRGDFLNPGTLLDAHSSEAFLKLNGSSSRNDRACAACHAAGASGPNGIVSAAFRASPGPLQIGKLAHAQTAAVTRIDEACEKCHDRHTFHQANVPREMSCSFCHAEHRGAGRMAAADDTRCCFCHGDANLMKLAAAKVTNLSFDRFHPAGMQQHVPDNGRVTKLALRQSSALVERPAGGFTKIIHSFAKDHPDFRIHAENLHDPNSLKFGHALHLTRETIPKLSGGKKLDCTFCHQPDATGEYMLPVNFENHCRICHSLQFDAQTPGLNLPHGDADFVSAFLHSLPKQYADFAARSGITSVEGQREFVGRKLQHLQAQVTSGEEFEQRVFFSTALSGPVANVGTVSGQERAVFPGCAYCHEVNSTTGGKAEITKPLMFQRWLSHARFNHAKHSSLSCVHCHEAENSRRTEDIILPRKETCAACHSRPGGVAHSCVTCHVYHHKN